MLRCSTTQSPSRVTWPDDSVNYTLPNAAKYGALSTTAGNIEIRWSVDEEGDEPKLVFRWLERGGPAFNPPQSMGFGTTLLNSAISGADGTPRIEYAPEGVRYTLAVPLSAIAAKTAP